MAKSRFLVPAVYDAKGLRGLLEEGGRQVRCAAVTRAVESTGADALGVSDRFLVVDVPDAVRVASLAFSLSAAGVARTETAVRITPEEIDLAVAQRVAYRPLGRS